MDERAEGEGGPTPASAVVLAGGASRRLGGGHKAFLRVGGQEVLERILSVAANACSDVLLVANDEEPYRDALHRYGMDGVRVVQDRRPGLGPLAGFEAGFDAAAERRVWVIACDLPFLVPAVGRTLLDRLEVGARPPARRDPGHVRARRDDRVCRDARAPRAAVPRIRGRLQPLCAAYERRASRAAAACLDAGRRRTFDLLELLDVTTVPSGAFAATDDPRRLFLNLNDRMDLDRARGLANIRPSPE